MKTGLLVVGDQVFEGTLMGADLKLQPESVVWGEVVFNTCMTGYQEILTDPSYAGQMVCFTSSHIGNTGANLEDLESKKIFAQAAIISHYHPAPSNFRSKMTLDQFLKDQNVVAIHSIDTRALTLLLRDKGVTPGFIIEKDSSPRVNEEKITELKKQLSKHVSPDTDWILKVTTREPYVVSAAKDVKPAFHVVAYDYGIKAQLIRELGNRGCKVTVVPADYPAEKVLALKPDGVFLSNGPGDPSLATYAVKNVKDLLGKIPVFGVCMGHQILALALGAKTYKLKFGHRGGNQPVKDLKRSRVEISSHNHGYAVDETSLPALAKVSHVNLNDQCVEGLTVDSMNAFSVQYHPESSPGPHDSSYLFDQFIGQMSKRIY
jgi:carbamoyl-phosphate synthase small subunit